jgi:hypothetical protein
MRIAAGLAALVCAAILAGPAGAGTATSNTMLKFFTGGAGTIAWTSDGGSSTGTDNQSLELAGTTQGTDYSGAYAVDATAAGTPLAHLNASFDVKGYQGAGSPRISLPVDTNGDGSTDAWAYLSASYCTGTARSDAEDGFQHVDFQDPGCTTYTSNGDVLHGLCDAQTASGTIAYQYGGFTFGVTDAPASCAWTVATDEQPFLVLDEAPAVSFVDNLTIGGFNWQRPGKPGVVSDLDSASKPTADGGTMSWADGRGDSFTVAVDDVSIGGGVVAFAGTMANGTGTWAGDDGQPIQEYLDTGARLLSGKIGVADVAPSSTAGLEGPFAYTGTVTTS